jgi:hypothetical protein
MIFLFLYLIDNIDDNKIVGIKKGDNMSKRNQVEKYIIDSINKIDKENAEEYKRIFSKMSDSDFDKYMIALRDNETNIFVILPNLIKNLKNSRLFKLADEFKVILFDNLKFEDKYLKRTYYSNKKYLILSLPVRRVKQYLFGKIGIPESDKMISKLSGQVMQEDKGCKLSFIESQMLANKNLNESVIELLKVRGGDLNSYYKFKQEILDTGRANLSSLDLKESKPKSVIVAEAMFKAMHIDFNFV